MSVLIKRFRSLGVVFAALWLTLWGAGQANATIDWYNVSLVNMHTSQCVSGPNGLTVVASENCDFTLLKFKWSLLSYAPDHNGHAQVIISNSGDGRCITATSSPGPLTNSKYLYQGICGNGNNWNYSNQLWEMITASSPNGAYHYIMFYSPYYNVCLDGGIGIYGFPGQCNPNNDYQVWSIYHV